MANTTGQVYTEAFIRDIKENLYRGAEFLNFAESHDMWVNDRVVHIPNAGSGVNVVKNRSVLPAQIVQRADDQVSYNLNEYTSDPIVIQNIEDIQLSYPKRLSVMRNMIDYMNQTIGDDGCWNWIDGAVNGPNINNASRVAPTGTLLGTTGTKTAVTAYPTIYSGSGTGFRNGIAFSDFGYLARKFDNDNIPQDGRYVLIPADMWHDFVTANISTIGNRLYTPDDEAFQNGAVRKIYTFNVFVRPVVGVFAGNATLANQTLKAVGAAGAATDCLAAIAWHQRSVARALGTVKFFNRENDPAWFGSYYSSLVMFASVVSRLDAKGLAVLTQTYASA